MDVYKWMNLFVFLCTVKLLQMFILRLSILSYGASDQGAYPAIGGGGGGFGGEGEKVVGWEPKIPNSIKRD